MAYHIRFKGRCVCEVGDDERKGLAACSHGSEILAWITAKEIAERTRLNFQDVWVEPSGCPYDGSVKTRDPSIWPPEGI